MTSNLASKFRSSSSSATGHPSLCIFHLAPSISGQHIASLACNKTASRQHKYSSISSYPGSTKTAYPHLLPGTSLISSQSRRTHGLAFASAARSAEEEKESSSPIASATTRFHACSSAFAIARASFSSYSSSRTFLSRDVVSAKCSWETALARHSAGMRSSQYRFFSKSTSACESCSGDSAARSSNAGFDSGVVAAMFAI
ncbi:uncharacterized protein F4807DRAFT_341189 [Annulohypoxylon truncatum]|uniref:uncharacterized protein n=1 Tax=Annulohypoxylon truncatum TaxID=327061 RepID=UPI002007CB6F|nr:uncharacterized protein F4807DRAFT_341189 [Annulohypoxylon truncatum]KAI1212567.1 hypothetical protein F4807DRAFT_341189 [Annulohypoxylon truncatum]